MRQIFVLTLIFAMFSAAGQARKQPKMAAVYVPGYYIGKKNDTIRCQIQVNPEDPTDFYRQFFFISGRSKRPKPLTPAQTKSYGFEGRHFVSLAADGEKIFAERLTRGRLRFYEYRFNGKINGNPAIESDYFIRDSYAEGENASLSEARKISHKFYKKALKPYLQDQPMLWSDLDKYNFDKTKVVQTIREFNAFYVTNGN